MTRALVNEIRTFIDIYDNDEYKIKIFNRFFLINYFNLILNI